MLPTMRMSPRFVLADPSHRPPRHRPQWAGISCPGWMSPRAHIDRIRAAFARLIDAESRRQDELAAASMAKVIGGDTAALVCADRTSRQHPSSIDKFVTAVTSSEAAPCEIDLQQVPAIGDTDG